MRSESGPVPSLALIDVLSESELFKAVPADIVLRVGQSMRMRQLVAGELLMRQDGPGDSLYFLLQGTLRLSTTANGRLVFEELLAAGSVLGELALSTGHPRAATATAETDAFVAELTQNDFDRLAAEYPDAMATVLRAVARRLERYQIEAAALDSALLQRMSPALRGALLAIVKIEALQSGDVLLREGDSGDAMYLIVSGRLRVLGPAAEATGMAIAELGRGDTVGEASLMTGDARSATVVALRDSLVASLDAEGFKSLIERYPVEMMSVLTRQLTQRSRQSREGRVHDRSPVSIAVVPLSTTVDVAAFTARLRDALKQFGDVATLSSDTPAVRNTKRGAESRLVEWLNQQESRFPHVLYQTDGRQNGWTQRSLRQADRILLVVDAGANIQSAVDRLDWLERLQAQAAQAGLAPTAIMEFELVLLHSPSAPVPVGIAHWRAALPAVGRHHHVRLDREGDFARLARSLNHRLVGVALGGGFALGIAHIGVVRAMRELNIPIDCVGGTSMGAVIAAECAMDFDYEQMLDVIMNGCSASLKGDYTLPFVSLLSGAKLGKTLGAYLEKHTLEDFWLPYYSISASLRKAMMVVHTEGDALRSVLASCRAPIMFPPLPWAGDLLVDGGLVNNVPVDVMRSFTPGGTVIAIDVSPDHSMKTPSLDSLSVSGWRRAAKRLSAKTQPDLSLIDVLGRIVRLGGVTRTEQNRRDADCYLTPPLGDFKALDFDRGREIAEMSHAYALEALGRWLDQHGRPWDAA